MNWNAGYIAVAVVLVGWIGWSMYWNLFIETPEFTLLDKEGSFELREYSAQVWISTPMNEENAAFNVLGGYIFGNNKQNEKIAMTAPVITDDKMTFVLPKDKDLDNVPEPNSDSIEFTTVESRKVATLTFSMYTNDKKVARKTEQLLQWVEAQGLKTEGEVFLMRYNDPWTLPFLRKNEVGVVIQ